MLKSSAVTLISALMACFTPAHAMDVQAFTDQTWADWQTGAKRPLVVFFTASDCAHCPGTLAALRREQAAQANRWSLRIVQIDSEPYEIAHSTNTNSNTNSHSNGAATLWQFSGPVRRIQYTVNPQWRGVTPYVVLLGSNREPIYITGTPNSTLLGQLR